MARILPGFVWPTAQDIDPLLARVFPGCRPGVLAAG
jgi:hypothetical protein